MKLLSDEERHELEDAIRSALAAERPRMVEDVKSAVGADLDKRFEMLGLSAQTPERREEVRKDMEFVRRWRDDGGDDKLRLLGRLSAAFDAASTAVGKAVMTAILAALIALAGYGASLKGWLVKP